MGDIRRRATAIGVLLRLIFRADVRTALLALAPVVPAAAGTSFLAARSLLRALGADDSAGVTRAAVVFAAAFVATVWLGRVVRTTRIRLGELAVFEFNGRVLAAVSRPTTVEHLERPDYLDDLQTARSRILEMGLAPRMLGWLVDSGGGIAVSVVLLGSVEPGLALVVLGGIPSALLNGRVEHWLDEVRDGRSAGSRRALHLYDVATRPGAAKEVRAYELGDELLTRYHQQWTDDDAAIWRAELRAGALRTAGWLAQAGVFGVGVAILVQGVRRGDVLPAELFLALGAMGLISGQLTQAAGGLSSIGQIGGLFDTLARLEQEGTGEDDAPGAPVADRLVDGIRLDGLSYRYREATGDALADVDLDIPAGSVVAIVGENGAGKTTLVDLLLGLHHPSGGSILADGVTIGGGWGDRATACFQDFLRLELPLQEVVGAGWLPKVDDADHVLGALTEAGAAGLVERLPDGLATQLGTRFGGVDLSGGQWQSTALARSMARHGAVLLVIDEPTSALDPIAEAEVFARYADFGRRAARRDGAVVVLVSHRFSGARMADLVVVLAAGRVVEVGSHDDLVAAEGLYAELYELQARYFR